MDDERLLRAVATARRVLPAYDRYLTAAGWRTEDGFTQLPLTNKAAVFAGPDGPWLAPGSLSAGSEVFTSSGHGGTFSYGIGGPELDSPVGGMVAAITDHHGLDNPLVLSCLPQAITVRSPRAVNACSGTNVDSALELLRVFGARQGGAFIAAEPLLAKELLERYAQVAAERFPIIVATGGEWPSEGLRSYLRALVGDDLTVIFSYGAAELGIGAMRETPQLAALRSLMFTGAVPRHRLTGAAGGPTPALYEWDAERLHVEVVDGSLVVTTLTPRPLPLVRYDIGDAVKRISGDVIRGVMRDAGYVESDMPKSDHVLMHYGRSGNVPVGGASIEQIKDWLFATADRAARLTGRFYLERNRGALSVELRDGFSYADAAPYLGGSIRGVKDIHAVNAEAYRHHRGGHERKARYEARR